MRKKSFAITLFGLLYFASTTLAQKLAVEERTVKNEESNDLNSWTASVDQDVNYCMETYSDFIKELVNVKVGKRGKSMLVAEKTLIPELSDLRLDQRAIFTAESGGTAVSFTFSPGYDIHFGREVYKNEFAKAEAFVKNYVRYHYKAFYNEKIKSIQDKIKSKQNDIETNAKKTERNNKTIAENSEAETDKAKTKNEKMLRENEAYASDTTSKKREISDLEEELSAVSESLRKVEAFK
ncbi:MAG: hypothetical protein C0490_28180 [Marivirga sp.]|nr:hypothetical protein [Marivirga sp.]